MSGQALRVPVITRFAGRRREPGLRRSGPRLRESRNRQALGDPVLVSAQGNIAPDTDERVMDEAIERFSRVDTLADSAGVFVAKPFTAAPRRSG
jgi:hypothetical protein